MGTACRPLPILPLLTPDFLGCGIYPALDYLLGFFLQEIDLRKALIPFIGVRVSHNQIVRGIYFSNRGQDNFHGG
jgi:hypothetical protein